MHNPVPTLSFATASERLAQPKTSVGAYLSGAEVITVLIADAVPLAQHALRRARATVASVERARVCKAFKVAIAVADLLRETLRQICHGFGALRRYPVRDIIRYTVPIHGARAALAQAGAVARADRLALGRTAVVAANAALS